MPPFDFGESKPAPDAGTSGELWERAVPDDTIVNLSLEANSLRLE